MSIMTALCCLSERQHVCLSSAVCLCASHMTLSSVLLSQGVLQVESGRGEDKGGGKGEDEVESRDDK